MESKQPVKIENYSVSYLCVSNNREQFEIDAVVRIILPQENLNWFKKVWASLNIIKVILHRLKTHCLWKL